MLLETLTGTALSFIYDLAKDHGEDLAIEGVKKVTGIDLRKKNSLSDVTGPELLQIHNHEEKIRELDYKELKLEYEQRIKEEKEKTKRWLSDNLSDSRFAKLVRPMTMIYLVIVISILAVLDGNISEFSIKEHWVTLFTSLALTAVGGYFTLRTYEKRTGTSKWK